jgi:hypothetical protein
MKYKIIESLKWFATGALVGALILFAMVISI